MYTDDMRELIKKVEKTRPERIGQEYPRMKPEERDEVLNKYHPDYSDEGFKDIELGVNKGDKAPIELAEELESHSFVDLEAVKQKEIEEEYDVLIIGGGGAGAAAALEAEEQGADVLLATKLRFGDANTMMAQGGIQAADKPDDSPARHFLDVIGGGHYENVRELVRALVEDAPGVIDWLEDYGVMLDKLEDGEMMTTHGGGTSRERMHAARDYTGAAIMRALRDEVRSRDIDIKEFNPAVEIMLDDEDRASGAVLYNLETKTYSLIAASTVVIAAGGSGRLHFQGFPTSNHYGATGDGLVMGYRAGAELIFPDTLQYHPTGAVFPPQIYGSLVTEKVRGLGATPINAEGEQFVYPLETRDVEAAALIRECQEKIMGIETPIGKVGVWLDTPLIEEIHGSGTIKDRLPAMFRQFKKFGINMSEEPILVYPTLHYQNGGLLIDEWGQSTVEDLYVAGESAGGIHGSNRLMGNSLLDILVFGRRAGSHAGEKSISLQKRAYKLDHVKNFQQTIKEKGLNPEGKTSPMLLPEYSHGRE
ncbi:FAD-dependent oxidoreductase [Halarsenatibacter silvermanii]|uniref:Succinate dehydrogenase / fumarate reductase flavoprotein subunit n=1 Tax=Halarsenatibacter silvermanii TaxID=321763 RepID=A0A1G9MDG4_9FIRM|nr:FAD-dependent oxidoreductase [Halarsenatibacter silvermanii]SDL72021.1 succinate dehydrogenase / fumarate reductase flavoprotein subunit [Halarsenatibacter silvermanii]